MFGKSLLQHPETIFIILLCKSIVVSCLSFLNGNNKCQKRNNTSWDKPFFLHIQWTWNSKFCLGGENLKITDQAWVSSVFPQKYCALHDEDSVPVMDSLHLNKWCNIMVAKGFFVAITKISRGNCLFCMLCECFWIFYFFAHPCLLRQYDKIQDTKNK